MLSDGHRLIRDAAKAAAEMFLRIGEGPSFPIWLLVLRDGRELAMQDPPADKDTAATLVRQAFDALDVVGYVHIAEAWTLDCRKDDVNLRQIGRDGLKNHPGRREALVFTAETEGGGMLSAWQTIERKNGKVQLLPLEWSKPGTRFEGRLAGMLPRRGKLQ